MSRHYLPYLIRRLRDYATRHPDRYLHRVSGVIHVGANLGQERDTYAKRGLNVIWVEPIPDIFVQLDANIRGYGNQRAFQRLLSDRDGAEAEFHVSSNEGASSSLLDLHLHREVWPHVDYVKTLRLPTTTLDRLVQAEGLRLEDYGALVLDTQGAELLVLQGAERSLSQFRYVKTEAADFEAYRGGCSISDLAAFLGKHGFRERSRDAFAARPGGGTYFDVLFERSGA